MREKVQLPAVLFLINKYGAELVILDKPKYKIF